MALKKQLIVTQIKYFRMAGNINTAARSNGPANATDLHGPRRRNRNGYMHVVGMVMRSRSAWPGMLHELWPPCP
ncbi:hypothetical protein M5D96_000619 [Drosophila gunungcola]|uniref:Uncharacterized protein n=1 Tax=Drosophila gunungcola TaxID=103775 RepID=A0A9P9YX47_9MUSC|nr:hypothetical protein M5D96_000619 [Drosophila gunungcola]